MSNDNEKKDLQNQYEDLLQLMKVAMAEDKALRDKYQIGEKFRFIRDRLQVLLSRVETNLLSTQKKEEHKIKVVLESEQLVYVYLFNAQGMSLPTWQKMLTDSVFYEYSINRPIYANKKHVEAVIRTKSNRLQHGFLTVAVNKEAVILSEDSKDNLGNAFIKVKEGALRLDRLITFTHNNIEYELNEKGEIILKKNPV